QNFTNKTTDDPPLGDATQALVSAKYVKDAINAAINAAIAALGPPVVQTGDIVASIATTKTGWLKLRGTTFGNAGSGAAYANADAQALFNLFWSLNGSSWAINGGRGASAAADWAALKTI